jgi:LemA protein
VLNYNNKLQTFPSNMIAGMFNFTPRQFFETTSEEEREPVKVDLR